MGKTASHLLVKTLLGWLLTISLPCLGEVKATDYNAFWLWSGVKAQPVLNQAQTLYLLQGQIVANYQSNVYFIKQGNGIIKNYHKELWLVYRTHTLNWSDTIFNTLLQQLASWQQAKVKVIGIQIDFDSATNKLAQYLTFLTTLRKHLPVGYKLSVTGLLDWGHSADLNALNNFANVVDELVIQTYQGKTTIANYHAYLEHLAKLTIPFKIGLVQYGQWQAPPHLANNPLFKGYVVFLQNTDQ